MAIFMLRSARYWQEGDEQHCRGPDAPPRIPLWLTLAAGAPEPIRAAIRWIADARPVDSRKSVSADKSQPVSLGQTTAAR